MSFSRGQQPELRKYLLLAWTAHCAAEGVNPALRCRGSRCGTCDYCAWYEDVLHGATGHRSSTECNAGRDYDFFMRDLEEIHGQSIEWQMRAYHGDAKRMIHELRKIVIDHDIDEDYLRGVARRMLQRDRLPELHTLSRETLIAILGEVKRFCRRKLKRDVACGAIDIPF